MIIFTERGLLKQVAKSHGHMMWDLFAASPRFMVEYVDNLAKELSIDYKMQRHEIKEILLDVNDFPKDLPEEWAKAR